MSAHENEPMPLGGEARKIVDAAARAERLSPHRKAEMRRRVMASVAAGAAISAGATAAAAADVAASASAATSGAVTAGASSAVVKAAGFSLFAKIGLAVAITTVGTGGYLWSRANAEANVSSAAVTHQSALAEAQTPSNAADSASAQAPVPSAEASAPSASNPGTPSSTVSAQVAPSARSNAAEPAAEPASPSVATTATPASADGLAAETKLLVLAQTELSKGNAALALTLLDEHAAKFPRGALAPERRAARAMALCKLGRSEDGRTEADALYGAGSQSPLAEKIRRACAK